LHLGFVSIPVPSFTDSWIPILGSLRDLVYLIALLGAFAIYFGGFRK